MRAFGWTFVLLLLTTPAGSQDNEQKDWWKNYPLVTGHASTLTGKATALSGSTILLEPDQTFSDRAPLEIQLWGIEAPEMKAWPWGPRARGALDWILRTEGPYVRCEVQGLSHNRIIADCDAGKKPTGPFTWGIGRAMLRSGFAVLDPLVTEGLYFSDEQEAQYERRGVWKDWAPYP